MTESTGNEFASRISRPGVFLDRDGTIIEEKHYLSRPEDVVLLPTAADTIARLNSLGIAVAVVTNQAGIARGYFPETLVAEVHARLDDLLAPFGAKIDRYDYCPHHATEGQGKYRIDCNCRKPKPGMLTRAAEELGIDLSRSLMIGDRFGDLQAGANAGCQSALVRTGYGASVSLDFEGESVRFRGAFASLADAVDDWMRSLGSGSNGIRDLADP
ncbi:MAG: HAD family hydrolase [Planctomycetes bacterium]|nr:HAD family hydrolase [Planctomycetota bacterium]